MPRAALHFPQEGIDKHARALLKGVGIGDYVAMFCLFHDMATPFIGD